MNTDAGLLFPWLQNLTNSDIIAFCSLLVAIVALGFGVWQAALSRQHNRISIKPYLTFTTKLVEGDEAFIGLSNCGLGPALVNSITYSYLGKDYDSKLLRRGTRLRREIFGNAENDVTIMKFFEIAPIRDGEDIVLISIPACVSATVLSNMRGVEILVAYQSAYGSKFKVKMTI